MNSSCSSLFLSIGALMATFAPSEVHADPSLITARIGYATGIHGEVAKVLAKTDLAKENGIDAQLTFFQYGPPQIEGLVSKTLDVSFTSLVPTATYLDKQPGAVKVIAELGHSIHGLIVHGDSPFKTLSDLKGATIGVPFSSDSHVDLLIALRAAGLDPAKDVKLQNLAPNEQAAAFQQKLVDAVLVRPPVLGRLQQEQQAREIREWPHHLWVIARADYLKENPGVEQKLVSAIAAAVAFERAHPEEAAAWYAEDLRQKPAVVLAASRLDPLLLPTGAKIDLAPSEALRAFADQRAHDLVELGLTKNRVNFFSN